ncbi:hypothetical protein P170DRAFT_286565 [Aspergillus steynii IBT 23096]|uniref:Uncharacterized protein n=1 Tax=Aspergillus steynii IBT 23096 TaxID=1392250 RepID=A0A2I2FV05_9EURO|nr:uncharacterized protein P170DRAFT_286565 [Aspergillus steynii IBT 23096]PLB44454.1 hypothetical protein P170DRAFT_286565 [Aspergillus steynii IBT 23096]
MHVSPYFQGKRETQTPGVSNEPTLPAALQPRPTKILAERDRYVEMLERDRQHLIDGLRKLYHHTVEECPGEPLAPYLGDQQRPPVHEILSRLQVLSEPKDSELTGQTAATGTTIETPEPCLSCPNLLADLPGSDDALTPSTPSGFDFDFSVPEPQWPVLDSDPTCQSQESVAYTNATADVEELPLQEEWPMQGGTGYLLPRTHEVQNTSIDEIQWPPTFQEHALEPTVVSKRPLPWEYWPMQTTGSGAIDVQNELIDVTQWDFYNPMNDWTGLL